MRLQSAETLPNKDLVLRYAVRHGDEKTVVEKEFDVVVDGYTGQVRAEIKVATDAWQTQAQALDQLARWLERVAAGLREGGGRTLTVLVGK